MILVSLVIVAISIAYVRHSNHMRMRDEMMREARSMDYDYGMLKLDELKVKWEQYAREYEEIV